MVRGIKAVADLSKSVADFGTIAISEQKTDSLWIKNAGNSNLQIDTLELINSASFTLLNDESIIYPIIVAPSDSVRINIAFSPDQITNYSGRLKVVSNNFGSSINYIYLLGAGKSVNMELLPSLLDFEVVPLGQVLVKNFKVRNNGSVNIDITSLEKNEFVYTFVNSPSLPHSLAPGEEVNIGIRFLPVESKIYPDTVKVITSSGTGKVILNGTGGYPVMELSTEEIIYDSLFINNSVSKLLTVRNKGTINLEINDIDLSSSAFRIVAKTNNIGKRGLTGIKSTRSIYDIAAGDSLEFYVIFTPKEEKIYNDTIIITSNVSSREVRLYGKGAKPELYTDKMKYYLIIQ